MRLRCLSTTFALAAVVLVPAWLSAANGPGPASDARAARRGHRYTQEVWRTQDGLPQNIINAILQGNDGYLWLGTNDGLARFDGVRFTVFHTGNSPGLASSRIVNLIQGSDGSMWIATEGGGLTQFSGGVFRTVVDPRVLPHDVVQSIHEESDGTVWLLAGSRLQRLRKGDLTPWTRAPGQPTTVRSIASDHAGSLWISTDRGLTRLRSGVSTMFTTADGLPTDDLGELCADQAGSLWIATPSGLARFSGQGFATLTTRDGLMSDIVRKLHEGRDGSLWIFSESGVDRLKDGQLTSFAIAKELAGREVKVVCGDREGSLWIGTHGAGLYRFKPAIVTVWNREDGLPSEQIYPILEARDGSMWIGTDGGGLARLKDGRISTFTARDGLANNRVFALYEDRDGSLWIGTASAGLSHFKDGRFTTLTERDGLPGSDLAAILRDRAGNLWIGTDGGGLNLLRDGKFTAYTTKDGLPSDYVRGIHEDREGALWIATDDGVSRLKEGRFTNLTTKDGLSDNFIRPIYEDREGTLWFGTYGNGLNRLKDGRLTRYTAADGLFDRNVSQILEDDKGNLWMTSNRGVFRVSKRELNDFADGKIGSIVSVSYGRADGLANPECNGGVQPAGWRSRDGKLWLPTWGGVAVIDPAAIEGNRLPPPVVIEDVIIDKVHVDPSARVVAPPGAGALEVHYTALSLLNPAKVWFKYSVGGFDRGWVDARTRRDAYYTNIPPGSYRFRVIACNNDGVWNETGASVELTLRPHFHQTVWFYLLCVIAVAFSGGGAHLVRVSRLKARERELSARVEERTKELRQEIAERKHAEEALRHSEAELRQAQKMEAVGTLAGGIAHDFNNLLQSIQSQAELLRSEANDPTKVEATAREFGQYVSRGAALTRQLLLFSRREAVKRERLDINETVRKGMQLLRHLVPASVEMAVELADGGLPVDADRGQLYQVLMNLVINAVNAMPDGGTIRVRTGAEDHRQVWVSIEDTGHGIPDAIRERIFEPFFTTKVAGVGSGLGLSVVHGIVAQHGGRIEVESTVGKGSTFRVVLPRVESGDFPRVEEVRFEVGQLERGRAERILVVEDEDGARETLRDILTSLGYEAVAVASGEAAGVLPAEPSFDLLLTDLMLPGAQGVDVARGLVDRWPTMSVIIMSGYAEDEAVRRGISAGEVRFLQKPFDMATLAREVRAAIDERSASAGV